MMRFLFVAAAALSFTSMAKADDESVISVQNYQDDVAVTGDTFHCTFTPGHAGGYIVRDTAWATLALGADDIPVFTHDAAGLTAESAGREPVSSDPSALCPAVKALIADAAASGGKLSVKKQATLSILTYTSGYGRRCERYLREALAVTFPSGLTLTSEQYKALQSGSGACK